MAAMRVQNAHVVCFRQTARLNADNDGKSENAATQNDGVDTRPLLQQRSASKARPQQWQSANRLGSLSLRRKYVSRARCGY